MIDTHYGTLPIGHHVGEYVVNAVIGRGAFGITYKATDVNLDMPVAIKEYLPSAFAVRDGSTTVRARSTEDQPTFEWGLDRFVVEAKTLARFDHPNLVRVHRFLRANGTAYMVMNYERGASLDRILKTAPTPPSEYELRDEFLLPLLAGLEELHEAGILHRDIKPGNIHVREDKTPVLLDFGAAREAVGNRSQAMTSIFTPGYAPIEQYQTDIAQGPWTDIYSLAATAYRVILGEAPPEAPRRVRNDPYRPAEVRARGMYSPVLLRAIDVALSVEESDRPQSVREWRDMLREAQTQTVPLRPRAPAQKQTSSDRVKAALQARTIDRDRQPRSTRRNAVVASVVTAMGASLAGALLALYLRGGHERAATEESGVRETPVSEPFSRADDSAETQPATEGTRRGEKDPRRAAEEGRRAEEAAPRAEEARRAEETRHQSEETERATEARRVAEQARRAEEDARRAAEESRRAEEVARRADEARRAEEVRRQTEEARRATEARRAAEKTRRFETPSRAAKKTQRAAAEARRADAGLAAADRARRTRELQERLEEMERAKAAQREELRRRLEEVVRGGKGK